MQRRALTWLLAASVVLNLAMAFLWLRARPAERPQRPSVTFVRPVVTNLLRPIRTNLVIQPRLLNWAELESTNYSIYISNLRAIGCPEDTVRDIIVADVNQLFTARRDTEVLLPSQQWWRSAPDAELAAAAEAKLTELDIERRGMLDQLLGPGWDSDTRYFQPPQSLPMFDGPVLSALSQETKTSVRSIEAKARAALQQLKRAAAAEGREVPASEIAALHQRTHEQLAQLLGPAELEEYTLRYSPQAERLRTQLHNFDATPEEFRALFQATEASDRELAQLAGKTDVTSIERRAELEKQREAAVREALGSDRYAYHQLAQQPGFIEARTTALKLGVGADTVLPLYQLNLAASEETRRVFSDTTLTSEQRTEELAMLEAQRLEMLRQLLGEEAFRRLQRPDIQ
jgi:hypothetical protein